LDRRFEEFSTGLDTRDKSLEHDLFRRAPTYVQLGTECVSGRHAKGRKPGRALDIGVGEGRNSVFLAKAGWDVTGFDIAEQGLELTRKAAAAAGVKVLTIKAAMEDFDFGNEQWDLIVATYEGARWREKAIRALKPGGIVVVEGFLRAPRTPPGASFGPNELLSLFLPDFQILHYKDREGKPDFGPVGRVVQLCAQKFGAPSPPAAR
jgi:SAM-dependent methyltransferase